VLLQHSGIYASQPQLPQLNQTRHDAKGQPHTSANQINPDTQSNNPTQSTRVGSFYPTRSLTNILNKQTNPKKLTNNREEEKEREEKRRNSNNATAMTHLQAQ
jgi:hypothetical protein